LAYNKIKPFEGSDAYNKEEKLNIKRQDLSTMRTDKEAIRLLKLTRTEFSEVSADALRCTTTDKDSTNPISDCGDKQGSGRLKPILYGSICHVLKSLDKL